MFLSLTDFFSDESSVIQVDSSGIDVSEFEDQDDKDFLITHGHEILRITAKADYAKAQICKAIDQRAEDAKGKEIYLIQERFKDDPNLKGGLMRYFHSIGFWHAQMQGMGLEKNEGATNLSAAFRWANAYRAALEMKEKLADLYSPEELQAKMAALPATVVSKAYTGLSEADREAVYMRIAEGQPPSVQEIQDQVKSPEAKLSKAEELLEKAKIRKEEADARWESVKADPTIPSTIDGEKNPEYHEAYNEANSSGQTVSNLEAQIAELQARLDSKDTELSKFKFDDETRREQRIKSLTAGLTIGVPQTIADLQKFFIEADHYPEKLRAHLNDQVKVLADLCGDYLTTV